MPKPAILALAALLTLTAHAQRNVKIQLLAINDLHGNLEPPSGPAGMVNSTPAGGVEYLATHLARARRTNLHTLVVSSGDLFGASPLLSSLFKDQPTIEAANAFHLDLNALGNHELDHGPAALRTQLRAAKFHFLAANTVLAADPTHTLFPPIAIRSIGGVRIGFIGEILHDAPAIIATNSIKDLRFEEESRVANAAAARLERQGVHTIVLLIHVGGFQRPPRLPDGSLAPSTPTPAKTSAAKSRTSPRSSHPPSSSSSAPTPTTSTTARSPATASPAPDPTAASSRASTSASASPPASPSALRPLTKSSLATSPKTPRKPPSSNATGPRSPG